MIVDPATGMPIEVSSTQEALQAQSLVGQVGINQAMAAGYTGRGLEVLSHLPGATTAMGWNAWRGANTLINGGFNPGNRGTRFSNHNPLRPRTWGRMSDVTTINNMGGYSPFDILSRSADWGTRRVMGSQIGNMGYDRYSALRRSGILDRDIARQLKDGTIGKGEFFSSGTLSRISAGNRILRGSGETGQLLTNLGRLDPRLKMSISIGGGAAPTQSGMMHYMMSSMGGRYSQFASGYLGGTWAGAPTAVERQNLVRAGTKSAYLGGVDRAVHHLASGGLEGSTKAGFRIASSEAGQRLAASTGKAVGERVGLGSIGHVAKISGKGAAAMVGGKVAMMATGPVGTALMAAWMAYDLTKMGMSALGGAVTLAKDAVQSAQGSIAKPVMGMGYRDTTVAATSRQRGVMAIQNSRLNARSVLGTEGAQMAAHFG